MSAPATRCRHGLGSHPRTRRVLHDEAVPHRSAAAGASHMLPVVHSFALTFSSSAPWARRIARLPASRRAGPCRTWSAAYLRLPTGTRAFGTAILDKIDTWSVA